jgi:hypothetical protein
MFVLKSATLLGALTGVAMILSPAAVSAAPLGAGLSAIGLAGASLNHVEQAQGRPRARGGRPAPARRGGGGGRRGGGGSGAGAAAVGIGIGIVGGLIAAGAAAAADAEAVEACAHRYRSYDRETRTFIGHDGLEYSCP